MNAVPRTLSLTNTFSPWVVMIVLTAFLVFFPGEAFAADDKVLPYEEGIKVFRKSMTGPVPFVISLVGIIACGAMLIFGGEISGFMRTMVFIILVVAVIVQASSVVEMLGGKFEGTVQAPLERSTSAFVGQPA